MASEGEEAPNHDEESSDKFFWYSEDKNGNFTLRWGPPGNLMESRGPESLDRRQGAVDGNLDREHEEAGSGPNEGEGNSLDFSAKPEGRDIANPLISTALKRKDDLRDHEAQESETSTSHQSATLQQSNTCKRRKIAHIDDEVGETPKYDKSSSEHGGSTEYVPPSENGKPSKESETSEYDEVLNQNTQLADPSSTEDHAITHLSPQSEILEEEGSVQDVESSIFSSRFAFNFLQSTQPKNHQQDIQQNSRRRDSINISPFHLVRSDDERKGSVVEELSFSTPIELEHAQPDLFQSILTPPPTSPARRYSSQSIISIEPSPTPALPKVPLNKISCPERKRILSSPNRPASLTIAMSAWITKTQDKLDPFRTSTECWFHPAPPPPSKINTSKFLRPYGKIAKTFTWGDSSGRHSLVLNYGICHKLFSGAMNKQQVDGWIQRKWHLSHLCGNWSCVNPEHTTVESCQTNVGRNSCFAHREGCVHIPKCLKDLKANLGADGKLVPKGDGVEERIRKTYFWDKWVGWEWDAELERIKTGDIGMGVVEEEWENFYMMRDDNDEGDEHNLWSSGG